MAWEGQWYLRWRVSQRVQAQSGVRFVYVIVKVRDGQAPSRSSDARYPETSTRERTEARSLCLYYAEKNRTALRRPGRAKRWDGTRTGGELSTCGQLVC